jgi:hypothetical protein
MSPLLANEGKDTDTSETHFLLEPPSFNDPCVWLVPVGPAGLTWAVGPWSVYSGLETEQ